MFCSLSHVTLGNIPFHKLTAFDNSESQKRISISSTLDNKTVHQISPSVQSARVLTFPIVLSRTERNTLQSMNEDVSSYIFTLQTGDEVLEGYFRPTFVSNPIPDFFRYNIQFSVTSKLDA